MPPAVNCQAVKVRFENRRPPFAGQHGSKRHGYGTGKTRGHADTIERCTRRQYQKRDTHNAQKTGGDGERSNRRGEKQPGEANHDQRLDRAYRRRDSTR